MTGSTKLHDAARLQIIWSRVIGVADEAASALVRTSFSTIVREANDYACGIVDASGAAVCENTYAIPGFAGVMSRTVRTFLTVVPPKEWLEGDVMITNDPWIGAGHLPDFVMATPVFRGRKLVGFATSIAHAADIGGVTWSTDGREVFEEGLRIPPSWLYRRGRINKTLRDLIVANVRVPHQVLGDLAAQRAAGTVCGRRLLELMSEEGMESLSSLATAIQSRAESVMRSAIAEVPDGRYVGESELDSADAPLKISAAVNVVGDVIEVDYSGTSSQVSRAINCPAVSTYAHTAYALKCVLDPLTPRNEGSYRPIVVKAPEGTLVNPTFPAPVGARHIVLLHLNAAIYSALAQVIPAKIIAQSGTPPVQLVLAGTAEDRRPFVLVPFFSPGMGARPGKDGLSATPFPNNAGGDSVEVLESVAPVIFWEKMLAIDSGGPGKYRGGLGLRVRLEARVPEPIMVSIIADRTVHPARGIAGGFPGATAWVRKRDGSPVSSQGRIQLCPGEVLEFQSAGGGGFGPPRVRDPALLERDVADELVSEEVARTTYGWHSLRAPVG